MSVWRWDYRAHEAFIAPAREKSQIWRLLFGLVLVAAIFLALSQMIFGTLLSMMGRDLSEQVIGSAAPGQTAGAMLFLLGQLGLLGVAVGIVCVMVHGRAPRTLLGDTRRAISQFTAVSVMMALLIVVLVILPPYQIGGPLERNMSILRWLMLLPFGLVAVLVQVSAEEVLFRGYLQQQLAARFRSPLIWMLAPSALFGVLHYLPESAGSNAMTIAIWAGLFGLMAADLTARSGTLGPAIAVHFFNNVTAMLLTSPPDEMSGLALYVLPFGMGDEEAVAAWLPIDFGWMLVSWLAARLAIRA